MGICITYMDGDCSMQILDLGLMSYQTMEKDMAFRPCSEFHWQRRDWIPWEAWCLESSQVGSRAMLHPTFDVFSMGVILLYLCLGQTETRLLLERIRQGM